MLSLLPLHDFDSYFDQTAAALSRLDPTGTSQYMINDAMVFEFNLCGYGKEHIKVSVDKTAQLLRVKASPPKYNGRSYVYNSLNNKDMSYVVGLKPVSKTGALDLDSCRTEYVDGILRVMIPVRAKPNGDSNEITLEIN